jgi:hypothetical protein
VEGEAQAYPAIMLSKMRSENADQRFARRHSPCKRSTWAPFDGRKELDSDHRNESDGYTENLAGALNVEAKWESLKRFDMVALSDDGSKALLLSTRSSAPSRML